MHRVELEGDAMVALVQTEYGDWMKCFMVFGGGGDRLLDVKWLQAPAPESERGPRSEQEFTSDLDDFLGRVSKAGVFSGVVLVARRGEVIFEKAYGEARRAPSTPNRVNTRFNVASVEKIFTAVVVFELVEERKLALDGKLCDYLPNYPLEEACSITIDQLLTHTSGLPDMIRHASPVQRTRRTSRFRTLPPCLLEASSNTDPNATLADFCRSQRRFAAASRPCGTCTSSHRPCRHNAWCRGGRWSSW